MLISDLGFNAELIGTAVLVMENFDKDIKNQIITINKHSNYGENQQKLKPKKLINTKLIQIKMKKLLPIILLVPCVAMGANTHSNAYKAHATKAAVSRTVANAGPVSGTVKDETGAPVPGVSVSIKGTNTGTQTDVNGHFKINAGPGDVLVFTYVGYNSKEVTVGPGAIYDVSLTPNGKNLNEVVVTALGVKRSEKSLTYANQVVNSDALNNVKNDNLINSLNGRVAGVDISPSSSGVGGSVKSDPARQQKLCRNQPAFICDRWCAYYQ